MQNMTGRIFVYSHTLHTANHTKSRSANLNVFFWEDVTKGKFISYEKGGHEDTESFT